MRPDLAVEQSGFPAAFDSDGGVAVADAGVITEPSVVIEHDPLELPHIEVRESAAGHRLVAQIEILSPANKLPGRDRDKYLDKRDELDASDVSLVAIDLLRVGENPNSREVNVWSPYFVMCRPAPSVPGRVVGDHVRLQDRLPTVPVPLTQAVPRHPLNLQTAFNRTYDGGGYLRGKVNYAAPTEPALSKDDVEFAAAVLTEARLRPTASDD